MTPKPLTVYTFFPIDHTASYPYRVMTPLETARDLGLPVRSIVDRNIEGTNIEQRIKNFCEADVVLLYQPIGDGTLNNFRMAKSFIPSLREGNWKYPPTLIVETDDNLFAVDPHNPAFKHLGYADPITGKPIPRGYSISHLENGKRRLMYKDGQDDFDVERNRQTIDTYRLILNSADAVSCSTPRLKEALQREATPRQIAVFPNMVRFDQYPQVDLQPNANRIRILWQGGQNHFLDWLPLKDAIRNITNKYPRVEWTTWGVDYSWITEVIPPHRLTFIPWCPYPEYKLRRVMMNDDISLAPLQPNRFNDCRSAIKWYEASMPKRPAATLAQNTGPYADEIQDGQTGMLFDTPEEFEAKLSQLIESREMRKTLGANAKDWISENRDAMKEVPKQVRFWEQLREEAPYEQPHMPQAAWEKFEADMLAQDEAQRKDSERAQKELQLA